MGHCSITDAEARGGRWRGATARLSLAATKHPWRFTAVMGRGVVTGCPVNGELSAAPDAIWITGDPAIGSTTPPSRKSGRHRLAMTFWAAADLIFGPTDSICGRRRNAGGFLLSNENNGHTRLLSDIAILWDRMGPGPS
jgi:hypothetical protein